MFSLELLELPHTFVELTNDSRFLLSNLSGVCHSTARALRGYRLKVDVCCL